MSVVTKTSEEIKAWAASPEGQANLAETMARLKAREGIPSVEDAENPWITEERWAKAMTREQRDEYLAARRKVVAAG